jgi:hypothetical protein
MINLMTSIKIPMTWTPRGISMLLFVGWLARFDNDEEEL